MREAMVEHNYEMVEARMIKWKEKEMAQQKMEAEMEADIASGKRKQSPLKMTCGGLRNRKEAKSKQRKSYYADFINTYYAPPICGQRDPHFSTHSAAHVEETGFVDFLHWKKPGESFNPIQAVLDACGCFASDGT